MASPRMPRDGRWLPYLGLITLAAGIVYQGGQITRDIDNNKDRLVALEARFIALQEDNSTQIQSINVRTARIETKLDYALPDRNRK